MKLLIAGHSVEDHLIKNGAEAVQPGGIYYTCLGMLGVKQPEDEIYLHTAVRPGGSLTRGVYSRFREDFIEHTDSVPSIYLTIHEDKERDERYGGSIKQKLTIPPDYGIKFDGALINMITGYEVESGDLEKIRRSVNGPVYLDLHSLSRGFNSKNERIFRPVPDKQLWLKNIDILQANENEIFTLSESKSEFTAAGEVLGYGVKILIVTKAEKGARIYYKNGAETETVFVSAEKADVKNKVGCGDIFGAVFFYTYIKNSDLLKALYTAVQEAGRAVSKEFELM